VLVQLVRGAAPKKIDGPSPVHLLNPRPTHPPADFFSKYGFGRFTARGVQKHHKNIFAKSLCRKQKNRRKFRCQFLLDFFVLSRFRVFLSDGGSKTLQRNVLQKESRRKLSKKIDQKSKTDFCLDLLITFLGVSR
jgi:hypothetical protein